MWSASSARPSASARASARRRRPDSSKTPPLRTAPMTEIRWLLRSWTKTVTWGSCMNRCPSRSRRSASSSAGVFPVTGICPIRGKTTIPGRETRTFRFDSSGTSNTTTSIRSPGPSGRSAGVPVVEARWNSWVFSAAVVPRGSWPAAPGTGIVPAPLGNWLGVLESAEGTGTTGACGVCAQADAKRAAPTSIERRYATLSPFSGVVHSVPLHRRRPVKRHPSVTARTSSNRRARHGSAA